MNPKPARCAGVAVASCLLLAGGVTAADAAAVPTTAAVAIKDASFEGVPTWTSSRPGLDVVRTAAAHSGASALLLFARSSGAAQMTPAQSLVPQTSKDATYRLSLYVSANRTGVPATVTMLETSGATVLGQESVAVTATADGWQQVSLAYRAKSAGGQLSVQAGSVGLVRGAGLRIDDISITRSMPAVPAPPTQPVALRTTFGVSANIPIAGQSYTERYQQQMQAPIGARGLFYYFPPGQNPTWNANLQAVPADQDVTISTKVFDAGANAAFAAQVPRTRSGRVFYHYWQEPENDMTAAQYRERATIVAGAVASNPRITFGIELMDWTFRPASGRNWREWVIPEAKHLGVSLYGSGGTATATGGTALVDILAAAASEKGMSWGADAWGYALPDSATAADRDRRAQWVLATGTQLKARGATHANWFNARWPNGDYTLTNDPKLLAAWQQVLAG